MIKYHYDLIQGSEEWFAARCGILTASEMKHIITPSTLRAAKNDKQRGHLQELAAQRVTKYVEPHYIGDDMLRGHDDEIDARIHYEEHYSKVTDIGFITEDKWGFVLGYSPDGLVGDDGSIETKSRRQKFQLQTILNNEMPAEFLIQVQTGLLVSDRKWCDFNSYCGGMHMLTKRIYPDQTVQDAILEAATAFHQELDEMAIRYMNQLMSDDMRLIPTERKIELEITI